jgi:ribulose-phosphate 3-epimerase
MIEDFIKAGAQRITVHQESCVHLHRTLQHIRSLGCAAGVAINPATPVDTVSHILNEVDLILVMTVNPGFGGQKLIPEALEKAGALVQALKAKGLKDKVQVQIDGGVDATTSKRARELQIDILVAGNAVFGQKNYSEAILSLK